MEKSKLRDSLIRELWRMSKMDIIGYLREFVEGETAALWDLQDCGSESATPSQISEHLNISRARTANILRSLRTKGLVEMTIAADDRRKIDVSITEAGKSALRSKYEFLVRYFDLYVDVLGEENISELTKLLQKTTDCNVLLSPKTCN